MEFLLCLLIPTITLTLALSTFINISRIIIWPSTHEISIVGTKRLQASVEQRGSHFLMQEDQILLEVVGTGEIGKWAVIATEFNLRAAELNHQDLERSSIPRTNKQCQER